MNNPIIAIDVDDVLTQGIESLRLEVNRRLGIGLRPKHYNIPGEYRGYFDIVWQANGVSDMISMAALSPQMETDQSHILAADGALEILRNLKARFELVVITAREQSWKEATVSWLDIHFPDVFSRAVFNGNDTNFGQKTKGEICRDIGVAWLIDDNVAHVQSALKLGIPAVLFGEYGWQQDVPQDMLRCRDWIEVKEYFDGR